MKKLNLLRHPFVTGVLSLTFVGILTRCLGFVVRIFMSYTVGEEGMGILQLTMPVFGLGASLCAMGMQSALSRLTADYAQKHPGQDVFLLRSACICSVLLSLFTAAAFFGFASPIASFFLQEPKCAPLIRMLSLGLPFCCIHSCCSGYYYGHSRTRQPAIAQLTEQLVRIGTLVIIWAVRTGQNDTVTLTDTVFASVLSEAASAFFFMCTRIRERKKPPKRLLSYAQMSSELIKAAAPISANRLTTTFLASAENMMIPLCLRRFGMTAAESLSVLGVLSGMAMPFILFPSIINSSMAMLLLPRVASAHTAGRRENLLHYCRSSIMFSLGLGCLCTALFYLTGPFLGNICFHSALAGTYLRLLSLVCPFLYLGVTCSSILNGLGKPGSVFAHSLASFAIRLVSVALLVPTGGINGYMLGLLTAAILQCALHISSILRIMACTKDS